MSKTIKELADELGVSKDKVKYQTRKLPSELTTKKNGVTYLENEAISKIKANILGSTTRETHRQNTHHLPTDFLLEELAKRDNELAEKNKQINNLQDSLITQQKLLDQQQVLTLQANTKILELETVSENNFGAPPRKSFWAKLFK